MVFSLCKKINMSRRGDIVEKWRFEIAWQSSWEGFQAINRCRERIYNKTASK
jgi:hypothetical protein